jgi:hypothetical protein
MNKLWVAVKWGWWLLVAYMPIAVHRIKTGLLQEIGCPAVGDCYRLGTGAAFELDLLMVLLATLLWPACLWFLVVPAVQHYRRRKRRASGQLV